MKKRVLFITIITVFSLLVFGATNAFAEEAKAEKSWEFNLAPFYLWGVMIDGDLTLGTNTATLDVPFSDIVDNLEAAFIVHFEGMHRSNWGFLLDVNYIEVSNDVDLPTPFDASVDIDFKSTLAEFAGLYRIKKDQHNFDIIAGGRYVRLQNTVTTSRGPELVDADKDWVDPFAGLRWSFNFADQWTLVTRGDVGGIGVGSDIAAQGLAVIDWQPFKYVSFLAGYRALYMDYSEGSLRGRDQFKFEATIHGPVVGINFRW